MTDIVATLRKTEKTKMPISDHDHRVLHRMCANEIERMRALLKRYRTETPLGYQPHMIAAEIDAILNDR